jgi:hypothetical protein
MTDKVKEARSVESQLESQEKDLTVGRIVTGLT